jgi:DNA-directed RNA polymerase subunit RPC12/RpoP
MRHRIQQAALLTVVITSCSALSKPAASSDLAAITRQALISKCAAAVAAGAALSPSAAVADFSKYGSVPGNVITLPLENCGGSFCTLFTIDQEVCIILNRQLVYVSLACSANLMAEMILMNLSCLSCSSRALKLPCHTADHTPTDCCSN